jgi:hypothetical protein
MDAIPVPICYTYELRYIRKHCRIAESSRVKGKDTVVIGGLDTVQAPVAFRITRVNSVATAQRFDVRYDGSNMLWPVGDERGPVKAPDFKRGLAESKASFLGLLDVQMRAAQFESEHELFEKVQIRKRVGSSRDQIFERAQARAARLRLCEGLVYIIGGEPVICIRQVNRSERYPGFEIDILDSDPAPGIGWYSPHSLGSAIALLNDRAQAGLIFRIDQTEVAKTVLRENGWEISREAYAEIMRQEILSLSPYLIHVLAVSRQLIAWLSPRTAVARNQGFEILRAEAPILFGPLQSAMDRPGLAYELTDALESFIAWCEQDHRRLKEYRREYAFVAGADIKKSAVRHNHPRRPLDPDDKAFLDGWS